MTYKKNLITLCESLESRLKAIKEELELKEINTEKLNSLRYNLGLECNLLNTLLFNSLDIKNNMFIWDFEEDSEKILRILKGMKKLGGRRIP